MSGAVRLAGLAALAAATPEAAWAHMPAPGMDGFYRGVAYPFVTPPQALLLLALSVMIGSFETYRIRVFLGAFCLAMGLGVLVAADGEAPHAAMLIAATASSTLAALAPGRLWPAALGAVGCGGLLFGLAARDPGPVADQATVIIGTALAVNLALLMISVLVDMVTEQAPRRWASIAVRVVAAWIAAISLLLLALLFAP